MNRPVHFEFHVADVQRALKFYADVFGWKSQRFPGPMEYYVLRTGEGEGIDGGLMRAPDGGTRTINTIKVENVDRAVEKAIAHGATIALPKMPIPGVGWLAYCKDPDGQIFGVTHEDKNAK